MVETKILTLQVEVAPPPPPPGEPEFIFTAWNPPVDTREVFPVTAAWPSVTKTYKPGDSVYIQYRVKNIGAGPGRWTIVVKDLDTGATLKTFYGDLDPGYSFKSTPGVGVLIGKMPDQEWKLSVKVTP